MQLTNQQIQVRFKAPLNKGIITKAVSHEFRLKFHSETVLTNGDAGVACTNFLAWVSTLIPSDKYQIFLSLFKYPITTNELVEEIYSALEKIFDGRNANYSYQFINPELTKDWMEYKKVAYKGKEIWRTQGFEAMKTSINSVLIVDLPTIQTTEKPEPYFYWLDISKVVDFDTDCNGEIESIIFHEDEKTLVAIDGMAYRKYEVGEKDDIGEPLIETPHTLGFCPARFFWTTSLKRSEPRLKKAPITNQLSKLDWFLFLSISKQHLDLYAPYPIYSGYAQECDYSSNEGSYCSNGYLRSVENTYLVGRDGGLLRCPVCGEKRLAGVGAFIEVPTPNRDNEYKDLRNPIQITTVDIDSLNYNVSETQRIRTEIYTNVVGYAGDIVNNQAVNEKQISATFESRNSVLINLKRNFEYAQSWVESTICKLRYNESFLECSINYGTEFYLYTPEQLHSLYKQAKENGASDGELDTIYDQIVETENRNDETQLTRLEIIKQLEPLRHLTKKEAVEMFDKDLVSEDDMLIKLNLSNYLMRFERENTNIIEFGSSLSLDSKINNILSKFKEYANEQRTVRAERESARAEAAAVIEGAGTGKPSEDGGGDGGNGDGVDPTGLQKS